MARQVRRIHPEHRAQCQSTEQQTKRDRRENAPEERADKPEHACHSRQCVRHSARARALIHAGGRKGQNTPLRFFTAGEVAAVLLQRQRLQARILLGPGLQAPTPTPPPSSRAMSGSFNRSRSRARGQKPQLQQNRRDIRRFQHRKTGLLARMAVHLQPLRLDRHLQRHRQTLGARAWFRCAPYPSAPRPPDHPARVRSTPASRSSRSCRSAKAAEASSLASADRRVDRRPHRIALGNRIGVQRQEHIRPGLTRNGNPGFQRHEHIVARASSPRQNRHRAAAPLSTRARRSAPEFLRSARRARRPDQCRHGRGPAPPPACPAFSAQALQADRQACGSVHSAGSGSAACAAKTASALAGSSRRCTPTAPSGAHLGRGHLHRARQFQHQPRPAGAKHPRPHRHHRIAVLRHIGKARPIDLAEIHHQPRRIIQHPHPPRHRLRQPQINLHARPGIDDLRRCRVKLRQARKLLRLPRQKPARRSLKQD